MNAQISGVAGRSLPSEETCCRLEDFDGFLNRTILALEFAQLAHRIGGHPVADPAVDLGLVDPPAQRFVGHSHRLATAAMQAVRVSYSSAWSVTNRTARALNSSSYFFGMTQTTFPRKKVCIKPGMVQIELSLCTTLCQRPLWKGLRCRVPIPSATASAWVDQTSD